MRRNGLGDPYYSRSWNKGTPHDGAAQSAPGRALRHRPERARCRGDADRGRRGVGHRAPRLHRGAPAAGAVPPQRGRRRRRAGGTAARTRSRPPRLPDDGVWNGEFECTTVGGPVIVENVLVHRPTRSAFVTDFAFGHAPGDPWWFRFYAYLIGMPAGRLAGQSYHRYYHSDRAAVKRGFEKVLGLEWENLLAGHGRPVLGDGKAALRAALADWGMKVDAATML